MRGRWKKEILLFVIGAVWGFIYWGNTVWNPDVQYLLQDIKHIKLPLNWHWIFDSGVHLGIAALVLEFHPNGWHPVDSMDTALFIRFT